MNTGRGSGVAMLVILGLLSAATAQVPTTSPTLSEVQQQQLRELLTLIEDPNPPPARRIGATQLLGHDWLPAGTVLTLLRHPEPAPRIAIAAALAQTGTHWSADLVPPLLGMLVSEDEAERQSAAAALAGGPPALTLPAVRERLVRPGAGGAECRAMVDVLVRMPVRDALQVLVETVRTAGPDVAAYARAGLMDVVGEEVPADPASLAAWWARLEDEPLTTWQEGRIRQLQSRAQRLGQRVRDLENRLTAALREAYLRVPEDERAATLRRHLGDASPVVRLLGLDLVQSSMAEGRQPSAEVEQATRALLRDGDPVVRAIAAQTVAAQRSPADEQTFLAILAGEQVSDVQRALLNGLGYVGTSVSADRLLAFLDDDDLRTSDEAVRSLGRLAERGMLNGEVRTRVADRLLARFSEVRDRDGYEARVLWAMGRVADPRFGPVFVEVTRSSATPANRLAALRALAILVRQDPPVPSHGEMRAAIAGLLGDDDLATRRVAAETLAEIATPAELDALCARLDPGTEPDDEIRRVVWNGCARLLATLPDEALRPYVARLTQPPLTDAQRTTLLQQALAVLPADPDRGRRGALRSELATLLLRGGQMAPALQAARGALPDLHEAGETDLADLAAFTLDLALRSGAYDANLAGELNGLNPTLNLDALWAAQCLRIRDLLRPQTVALAIDLLAALDTHPPEKLSTVAREQVRTLRRQAEELVRDENRRIVRDGLVILRERPDDETARQSIVALGAAAIPELRSALWNVLNAEPLDREAERRIHDLLKQLQPTWPGFASDAPLELKRSTLGGPE